jgi:hypothetical protein
MAVIHKTLSAQNVKSYHDCDLNILSHLLADAVPPPPPHRRGYDTQQNDIQHKDTQHDDTQHNDTQNKSK